MFINGIEVPVKMAPHGNCTKNKRPYFRTQPSTLESVKENIGNMKPKDVVDMTYRSAGGILNIKSSSEVCRDRTQVYNMKGYKGCTSNLTSNCNKDLVYDLLEQHFSSESDFVQSVCFDESVMSVVGLDQQFVDMNGFVPVKTNPVGVYLV